MRHNLNQIDEALRFLRGRGAWRDTELGVWKDASNRPLCSDPLASAAQLRRSMLDSDMTSGRTMTR